METTELHDSWAPWEKDLGLPEGIWTDGLWDSNQEDVEVDQFQEGDSFWKDADFPLKEASKDLIVKDRPDQPFDLDELIKDDWLDERIDIGAVLDNFIRSPAFDAVLSDFEDSADYLKSMDLPEASSMTEEKSIKKEIVEENVWPDKESISETEVEIESDELALEETAIIYLDPCEVSSPSVEHLLSPGSQQIHFVISPSISATNNSGEVANVLEEEPNKVNSLLELVELPQDDADNIIEVSQSTESSDLCSLKSKRGRRKVRSDPYKSTWDDTSSSNYSSICSSVPSSPFSCDLSDISEGQPKNKRKERKKCQNRNAATKYRQKKRAECEAIGTEEQELETKNKELKEKFSQLSNEIGYLKGLMREILIAKGLINK